MPRIRCDFCSNRPVAMRYPAASATMMHAPGFTVVSDGDWAACATCAALVEADDREGLAVRTLRLLYAPLRQLPTVRRAQRQAFWEQRTGPGRPVPQEGQA